MSIAVAEQPEVLEYSGPSARDRVPIASICPWPVRIERPHFQPRNVFEIAACPKGSAPKTTIIGNQVQWEKRLSTQPPIPTTITAMQIAIDFVKHVSLMGPHMSEDCRPGVWICAGDTWTKEEEAENLAKLRAFCGKNVEEADDLDRRKKAGEPHVPKITERMKECARWLLLKKEWLSDQAADTSTICPFCTKTIRKEAAKCEFCNEIVNRGKYEELTGVSHGPKSIPSIPIPGKPAIQQGVSR